MAANGKVTLAVIATKLESLKESVDKVADTVESHKIIVDRLDQKEQMRTWHIRAIWAAMLAGMIKVLNG